MAFLALLEVASMPVLRILLISGLGAFLATSYVDVLTADARKHVNKGEKQERSQTREEKENLKATLLKEIAAVQVQTVRNHVMLRKMEHMLQEMKWAMEQRKVKPGCNATAPAPVRSTHQMRNDKDESLDFFV